MPILRLWTKDKCRNDIPLNIPLNYLPEADRNDETYAFMAALAFAQETKDFSQLQRLLDLDEDRRIHYSTSYPTSALHLAARFEELDIIQTLLTRGVPVDFVSDSTRLTALQTASEFGLLEVVRLLLDNGADPNASLLGAETPIELAIIHGRPKVANMLLESGALLPRREYRMREVLFKAVKLGDMDLINALYAATGPWTEEIIPFDHSSLIHSAVLSRSIVILKFIVENNPNLDINRRNIHSQTPLHVSSSEGFEAALLYLIEMGALVTIKDTRGKTPLELAFKNKHKGCALALFPLSPDHHELVKPSDWRSTFDLAADIIEIVETSPPSISFDSAHYERLRQYPIRFSDDRFSQLIGDFPELAHDRRILILPNTNWIARGCSGLNCRLWREIGQDTRDPKDRSRWAIQSETWPTEHDLRRIEDSRYFLECRFSTDAVLLPWDECSWPSEENAPYRDLSLTLKKEHNISWILTKPEEGLQRGHFWQSKIFFSTLDYAKVPLSTSELMRQLLKTLLIEWEKVFNTAEWQLEQLRSHVLATNGRSPNLIKYLIWHAQLWDRLKKICNKQIADLMALKDACSGEAWRLVVDSEFDDADEWNSKLCDNINDLESKYRDGLIQLAKATQDLVQLEFNLVSISEAQKSYSMGQSMKRLSWVTFVFLPLMFVSSLFGMNVDVLKSNPSWLYYLPLALVTTALTMIAWWIIRNRGTLGMRIRQTWQRRPQWHQWHRRNRHRTPNPRSPETEISHSDISDSELESSLTDDS